MFDQGSRAFRKMGDIILRQLNLISTVNVLELIKGILDHRVVEDTSRLSSLMMQLRPPLTVLPQATTETGHC